MEITSLYILSAFVNESTNRTENEDILGLDFLKKEMNARVYVMMVNVSLQWPEARVGKKIFGAPNTHSFLFHQRKNERIFFGKVTRFNFPYELLFLYPAKKCITRRKYFHNLSRNKFSYLQRFFP